MNLDTLIPNPKKALFFAKKQLSEFVTDAVNLEGIAYTLPEVQTLLDGVTVGGHSLTDERITLNQAAAWRFLFEAIENKVFSLEKDFVCKLHAIAAADEALEWGQFRSGNVLIAGTAHIPPPADALNAQWEKIIFDYQTLSVKALYEKAIGLFLDMAYYQFFYDVNKRMGRFMMNGILLVRGYPAINLPAKKQLKFNTLMLDFYASYDKAAMTDFMLSCLEDRWVKLQCN